MSINLYELLENRAQEKGDELLFAYLDKRLNVTETIGYQSLYVSAKNIAGRLQEKNVYQQPILLLYPHGPEFIRAFFGCILAGAIPIPLSLPRGGGWSSINNILGKYNIRIALCNDAEYINRNISEILNQNIDIISTINLEHSYVNRWLPPKLSADDIAFVQFSSGTTSSPKGVSITHKNILHNSNIIKHAFNIKQSDVGVNWLPFYHDMGLIGHIIQPLYSGISNYFMSPISFVARPISWLRAISKYKGSISGGPNFSYKLCNTKISHSEIEDLDLSSWRLAYCGSERVDVDVLTTFTKLLKPTGFKQNSLFPCYGMAESTLFVSGQHGLNTSRSNNSNREYACLGMVTEMSKVMIVDTETMKVCENRQIGEIWVKSESVADGYYQNSALSKEYFNQIIDIESGYLKTGDLGFLEKNKLFYVNRLKDVIKIRGVKYHSEDLEISAMSKLNTLEFIRCAAIYTENEHEDDKLIILIEHNGKDEFEYSERFSENVKQGIYDSFSIIPNKVLFIKKNSIPLTTSGKTKRSMCKLQYIQNGFSDQIAGGI